MAHVVRVEQFEGPLDLLLRLCEEGQFDLSRVSLAQVCDDYLATLRSAPLDPHALADFLVVASKLLLLKAESLMPGLEDEHERAEVALLEDQLKLLARYVEAGRGLERLWRRGPWMFAPARSPALLPLFAPPPRLRPGHLRESFRALLEAVAPFVNVGKSVIRRVLSLEQKLEELRGRLTRGLETRFSEIINKTKNREELIVSFLALLELVKQQLVTVDQKKLFDDIVISKA